MIEVKNLTKRYGTNTALNNVSFTVEEGTIVGVISNSNLIEELSELLGGLVRNIHSSKTREVTLRS